MKKSAITTAVALACAGGFAATGAQAADVQTSIYGIIDVGYASTSNGNLPAGPAGNGGKSAAGLITGGIAPNHLGVKASRDLGDGLKADLQVEAGFQLHNGNHDFPPNAVSGNNQAFFNRIAALGLSGEKWGRVSAGFQISPFVGALMGVDPMGLSQSGSAISFHLYDIANTYDNLFQRSLVTYATPNFSGFSATLSHGFNDSGSDGAAPTSGTLADKHSADIVTAQYATGGLNVAGAYYQSKDAAGNTLGKDTMIGAGYKFGQFSVKAFNATYDSGNGADKNSVIGFGGDANVGAKVNVALAYYTQKGTGTANNGDKTNMTVLKATYGLDRGSFLYATVSSTKNTKGAMVGPFMGSSSGYGSFTPAGESATGYSAGVFFAF